MSLFSEIRRLCLAGKQQTEDTLTEIVAEVLRNNHELTQSWLEELGIPNGHEAQIHSIETQYRVPGLADHETDSRIDLVIRYATSNGPGVAFVESKVGSDEMDGQLQRYAMLLQNECRPTATHGTLVFITRNYSARKPTSLCAGNYRFQPARWFQFYNILKSRSSSDGLEKQLMLFMEENHMSVGNQFRSTDLVALENFRGAKALMDETLSEAVDRMKSFGGKVGLNKAMTRLRIFGNYMLVLKFHGFEVLLGYVLPEPGSNESAWVAMKIQSDPKASNRKEVLDAIRSWSLSKSHTWESWGLEDPSVWSQTTCWKWLRALQVEEDHVAAVKKYFDELLEELEEFRKMFPNLPWTPQENPAGDDD